MQQRHLVFQSFWVGAQTNLFCNFSKKFQKFQKKYGLLRACSKDTWYSKVSGWELKPIFFVIFQRNSRFSSWLLLPPTLADRKVTLAL